jgi:hypothetical protein
VDRVPAEAIKHAPAELVEELLELFNCVKAGGRAPRCWMTGRVVLLHKAGPEEEMGNYRPLTIGVAMAGLNGKIFNGRLTLEAEEAGLLGEEQAGFRKGRAGSDNLFVLNTILWKSAAKRSKIHLAFIDLQKAYDTVDREELWKKLRAMGIGGSFLRAVQALYDADCFVTEVNGEKTRPIFLGRGLKQGCSLSPIFFALYVAGWGREVAASGEGVVIGNLNISVLFFADDILLVSRTAQVKGGGGDR